MNAELSYGQIPQLSVPSCGSPARGTGHSPFCMGEYVNGVGLGMHEIAFCSGSRLMHSSPRRQWNLSRAYTFVVSGLVRTKTISAAVPDHRQCPRHPGPSLLIPNPVSIAFVKPPTFAYKVLTS